MGKGGVSGRQEWWEGRGNEREGRSEREIEESEREGNSERKGERKERKESALRGRGGVRGKGKGMRGGNRRWEEGKEVVEGRGF